ncbi:MAG TPA: hypothetical protein VGA63_06100, partial [Geopsychrobacteraceae bacterium]
DAGSGQISGAIQQLDQVTQQNAASAEEMASTSEELRGQAEQLQEMIGFFNTGAVAPPVLTRNLHLRHSSAAR